jgi:CBS domain-containing protein
MSLTDFIRTYPPFDKLDETALQLIVSNIETKEHARGSYILRQTGFPSQYLYFIRSGSVRLTREGQTFDFLETGNVFGFLSVMTQAPPIVDVVAEEQTELYCLPGAIFNQLIDEYKEIASFFLKGFAERLRYTSRITTPTFSGSLTVPVETLVEKPPIFVKATDTVGDVARKMREGKVGAVLVASDPIGILTEYDFKIKVLANGLGADTPVHQVMSQPLKTIPAETPVYGAMLFMMEESVHRVPLTHDGEVIGMISAADMLRHQTTSPFYLFRKLENLDNLETLNKYELEIAKAIETLFRGGLDIEPLGHIVANLNDALIKRLLRLAEDELGPPPTPYAWLVFGSEGRMEQMLLTDQDNALVYQDDTPEAADYFAKLAVRAIDGLLQAGFPPCPGGCMAINWCKPLAEWEKLFEGWIMTPKPQALLEVGIFFDFRVAHGNLSVKSLENIRLKAKDQRLFLAHLARAALQFKPPLGFFWGVRKDKQGQIDLKRGAVAPIVNLARVYGLEAGGYYPSTLERLEAAVEAGNLSKDGGDILDEKFRLLLELRLEKQLNSYRLGRKPSNLVTWDELSPLEQRRLKDVFSSIQDYQGYMSQRFSTDVLG